MLSALKASLPFFPRWAHSPSPLFIALSSWFPASQASNNEASHSEQREECRSRQVHVATLPQVTLKGPWLCGHVWLKHPARLRVLTVLPKGGGWDLLWEVPPGMPNLSRASCVSLPTTVCYTHSLSVYTRGLTFNRTARSGQCVLVTRLLMLPT